MCTITDGSHTHLEVTPGDRREIARLLLAGAEVAGVDPADPCELTTTTEGFRVSAAVLAASGLERQGDQLDPDPAPPAPAEAPAPADQNTMPPRRRHRK